MGLDMYLYRQVYIGAEYHQNDDNFSVEIKIKKGGKEIPVNTARVATLDETVMYWRKANQIHEWFVKNVQNGVDDCGSYTLNIDTLKQLLEECKIVLTDNTKASEVLPTKSGFFFGGTEYNDDYYDDLKQTIDGLNKIIKEYEELKALGIAEWYDFIYQSSW